jgi:outer membrane protein
MRFRPIAAVLLSQSLLWSQHDSLVQSIENDTSKPKSESPSYPARSSFWDVTAGYRQPTAAALGLDTADRARSLVRGGMIYLSLHDALALAIENNLDVEVARYELSIAGTDRLRASGGGDLRGIDYSVAEGPTGVGGPGSPLLNSAASTVTPNTPTVNDLTSLNVLTETQSDLSVQGTASYSAGPPIPVFQPTFIGQNTWFQRSNTASLTTATLGTSSPLVTQGMDTSICAISAVAGSSS